MTRFYGDAVFEGAEVSDADYNALVELRRNEQSEIERAKEEAANRILEVKLWAEERIAEIKRWTEERIMEIERWTIERIAEINRWHDEGIAEQERWREDSIVEQERWREESIAEQERLREENIARIKENAQNAIDGIISAVTIEPVYEVRGESTACDICRAKIGEVGTMEMLAAKDCVPPFHENCRCWLEEIGYCIL